MNEIITRLRLGERLEKATHGPRLRCVSCQSESVNKLCFACLYCKEEENIFCRGCGAIICWEENEVCIAAIDENKTDREALEIFINHCKELEEQSQSEE